MSTHTTLGASGVGGQLSINTGADATIVSGVVTGGTFVPITEQNSGIKLEAKGVFGTATHMQSAAGESISLLPEPVDTPVTFNYIPGDPGQEALLTAMNASPPPTKQWKYVCPLVPLNTGVMQTVAEIRVFHAIATGGINEALNSIRTLDTSFRVTGGYIRIAGS